MAGRTSFGPSLMAIARWRPTPSPRRAVSVISWRRSRTRPTASRPPRNTLLALVYEGRNDLGNTKAGDGKRYKGGGLSSAPAGRTIAPFTKWIREKQPTAPDFEVKNPTLIEQFPWALLSAIWFWTTRGLNAFADRDDITRITKKINGGTNGLADRKIYLKRARSIWGGADIPVPTSDDDVKALQGDLVALGYDVKVGRRQRPEDQSGG